MAPLYQGANVGGFAALRDAGESFGVSQLVLSLVGSFCGSCSEFLAGSDIVKTLNSGPGGAAVPA